MKKLTYLLLCLVLGIGLAEPALDARGYSRK